MLSLFQIYAVNIFKKERESGKEREREGVIGREREREREKEREGEKWREREREREEVTMERGSFVSFFNISHQN
jgi:hypothetical protein